MALKKRKQGQNEQYSEFKIEFVPVIEEESDMSVFFRFSTAELL